LSAATTNFHIAYCGIVLQIFGKSGIFARAAKITQVKLRDNNEEGGDNVPFLIEETAYHSPPMCQFIMALQTASTLTF